MPFEMNFPNASSSRLSSCTTVSLRRATSATRACLPSAASTPKRIGGISPMVTCPWVRSKKACKCSQRTDLSLESSCIVERSGRHGLGDCCGLIELVKHIPGQQLLDAIDRMVPDALEHVLKIALRIDAIFLTRLD